MSLFLKQTDQRTQLQSKIAADLQSRAKITGDGQGKTDFGDSMLEDSQSSTGKSLFWAGVVTMIVVAAVVFMIFIFES